MSTSNVPQLVVGAAGVSVPTTSAILAGVLKDLNAAFGGNLNIDNPATPQGVLAAEITANIAAANAALALLVAMVDPATSEDRYQDAIARIYFLTRKPATATVVAAQCTGYPGFTLPAGSLADDDAGNTYASTGDAIFGTDGLADVQFQCQTTGPIAVGIAALTKITQVVPGWDAVTNLTAGTPGTDTETRAVFEQRRANSVAKNAQGSVPSIFGAVASVDGVTDCFVVENTSNVVVNSGATNYPLAAHSVYVAAVGGTDEAVAASIWNKKSTGCDYNGNTTVAVTDSSGYATPYPEYSVKFERPASLACKVAVTLTNNPRLPADIVAQTKAAILASWSGADGGERARIASAIYASRFYAGVAALSNAVAIVSVLIGTTTPSALTINVGIDQAPVLAESDITVTLV